MALSEHEEVAVRRGPRSGLTLIIAVHSTALGQAAGGCRLWRYPDWRVGLEDALRLSRAMTYKFAVAGLPNGGGKAVIPLLPGMTLSPRARRRVLLDLGDIVDSFNGRYGTAEDVGTTAEDMLVVAERTDHVFCLPAERGGIGEPAEPTAAGAYAALRTACREVFGADDLASRRFAVHGLGQVGGRLARRLAAAGASLIVSDIDTAKQGLASELGAQWTSPKELLTAQADVLVPASLGGLLTSQLVGHLRCRAIVGPANNQLADDHVADALAARGILWAPDIVVNAGGAIYGVLRERHAANHETAMVHVERIGETLADILAAARRDGLTPQHVAFRLAERRLHDAQTTRSTERGGSQFPR